jgi:putative membrane protein
MSKIRGMFRSGKMSIQQGNYGGVFRGAVTWILLTGCFSATAFAHNGKPHHFSDLPYTWGLDPLVVFSLTLSCWLYFKGVKNLWRSAEKGRGIRNWEAWAFGAGWFALFIALVSPLHPMGEVLFSAHMTQHEILMLVAAPLMVLGKPMIAFLWALPIERARQLGSWAKIGWFQRIWQTITKPVTAWIFHAAMLWMWHIPVLFQATLKSDVVHTAQHICFFGSALLFWWALIHRPEGLAQRGVAIFYLFTTSVHSSVLGALITFTSSLLYPSYARTTVSWGITALEDQQLGGLIMWVPAGLVYIIAGLSLCAGWMRESEYRVNKWETSVLMSGKSVKQEPKESVV